MEGGKDRAVTRIELFSPSNKLPQGQHKDYLFKRVETLEAGIHLIELDSLHETCSPFFSLPPFRRANKMLDYSRGINEAPPYYIAVTTAWLELDEIHPQTYFFPFRVDEPIPITPVPLGRDEIVFFDFGIPYAMTHDGDRFAQV